METVHLSFLAWSAVWILISDHMGALYFLGKVQTVPTQKMQRLHRLVWVGLLGMIISGAILMAPAWDFYVADSIFRLKMAFVGVLVCNGLFIGSLLKKASIVPFKDLLGKEKLILLISGALSGTGWVGSALIGFLWL